MDDLQNLAVIKIEQAWIEELLPAVKKETVVKEEADDLQDPTAIKKEHVPLQELHEKERAVKGERDDFQVQGDQIVIKEELLGVLHNLVEKNEFEEHNGKSTFPDRSSPGDFHHIENQASSCSVIYYSHSGVRESQLSVKKTVVKKLKQPSLFKDETPSERDKRLKTFRELADLQLQNRNFIRCNVSSKSSRTTERREQHVLSNRKDFACNVCSETFRNKRNFICHQYTHSNKKTYVCTVCFEDFSRHETLQEHFSTHFTTPFQCGLCSKGFYTRKELNHHLKSEHGTEGQLVCHVCSKGFCTNWKLKKHTEIHNTEKNYKCDICDRPFRSKRYLRAHRLMHMPETVTR